MVINITVKDRIATYVPSDLIPICGNNRDTVKFEFDEEWSGYEKKTARFIWGNEHHDEEFEGDSCPAPMFLRTNKVLIGVYVGEAPEDEDCLASTNAEVEYRFSARCTSSVASAGTGENYTNEAKGAAARAIDAAKRAETALAGFPMDEIIQAEEAAKTAVEAAEKAEEVRDSIPEDYKNIIVNTAGNSEKQAMSQKSVSDQLGFEVISTINSSDSDKWMNGYLDDDGTFHASSAWRSTDFIEVEEGQLVGTKSVLYANRYAVAFYDENKALVSTSQATTENGVLIEEYMNVPSGAMYIRFTSYNSGEYGVVVSTNSIQANKKAIDALAKTVAENAESNEEIREKIDNVEETLSEQSESLENAQDDISAIKKIGYNTTSKEGYADDISSFAKTDNAFWNVTSAGDVAATSDAWEYYEKAVNPNEVYHVNVRCSTNAPAVRLYDALGNGTSVTKEEGGRFDDYITIPDGIERMVVNNQKSYNPTAIIEKGFFETTFEPIADYLFGKRLVACGDSITDASRPAHLGGGYFESYAEITANRHGMGFTKDAKSGSTMAYTEDATNERINKYCFSNTRYLNLPEFDYLTIWFGWNDATYSTLGTINDTDNTTFYGAYKKVLDYLVTNNPTKKIGLVVPYGGSTVEPFAQAVRDISKLYGVPCLDLRDYNECSSFWEKTSGNQAIVARRDALTYDTTHPNQEGHEFLSTMYDNFIKRL